MSNIRQRATLAVRGDGDGPTVEELKGILEHLNLSGQIMFGHDEESGDWWMTIDDPYYT